MQTRLLAVLAICLAASLPYASTINNYFVNDDFGVVQLLTQKPLLYFPKWFVTSWMDNIWGATQDEIRPFPAVTYQLAGLWGATSPVANHAANIAFHAASALLVLAIARIAARLSLLAALYAALVFAILPLHAESVVWITGRVDTIPAVFFLGSFLAYAYWRQHGKNSTRVYLCSLALFFCALFSKQNTIVMVATLMLYDRVAERRPIRASWAWLAPYVPFGLLTIAYLLLRYALFGEVAREGHLTADGLGVSRIFVGKHLQRMFFGLEISRYPSGYIAVLVLTAGAWFIARSSAAGNDRHGPNMVLYFGPCWWLLCLAPLVVVGYESTRHVYSRSCRMGRRHGCRGRRPLAHPPFSGALRSPGRERSPVDLLRGHTASGSRGLGCQIACLAQGRLRPRARSSCGTGRKPADCRRSAAKLGVVPALRRAAAVHRVRSCQAGGARIAGADRLLPGSMDGAHATYHPRLVTAAVCSAGGTHLGCAKRRIFASHRARGTRAPEQGDGADRS